MEIFWHLCETAKAMEENCPAFTKTVGRVQCLTTTKALSYVFLQLLGNLAPKHSLGDRIDEALGCISHGCNRVHRMRSSPEPEKEFSRFSVRSTRKVALAIENERIEVSSESPVSNEETTASLDNYAGCWLSKLFYGNRFFVPWADESGLVEGK